MDQLKNQYIIQAHASRQAVGVSVLRQNIED